MPSPRDPWDAVRLVGRVSGKSGIRFLTLPWARRPQPCREGTRHRRAPGRRPVHCRGSRRVTPNRGDPDGGGDPEPPGVNHPQIRRQTTGGAS
jgi:hypothetical protein